MPTDAASSIQSEPAQGEGLVSISRRRDRSVTRIVTLAVIAVLIICPVVRAADCLEKTDFQKSRAFSPAVVTDGGRIVWLAGQTATMDADGKGRHPG